ERSLSGSLVCRCSEQLRRHDSYEVHLYGSIHGERALEARDAGFPRVEISCRNDLIASVADRVGRPSTRSFSLLQAMDPRGRRSTCGSLESSLRWVPMELEGWPDSRVAKYELRDRVTPGFRRRGV